MSSPSAARPFGERLSGATAPPARALAHLAACALVITGCATTDPEAATNESASLAARHMNGRWTPDWRSGWDDLPTWNGTSPLTSEEAVAIALRRNRELRSAVNEIAMAQAELAAATTPPNPVVSFTYGAPIDGGPGSMVTASVMAQLAWLWQRPSEVAAAEARVRERILLAADAALTTMAEVRQRHLDVIAAEETLRHLEEADAALALRRDLVTELGAAGAMGGADLRNADAEWRSIHRERLDAEAEVHHAKVMLLESLALTELQLDWSSDGAWPELPIVDAEPLAIDAPARRLDVAARAAALLAADHDARRAGLERLPEIELGAMFERSMEGVETLGPSIVASVPILDRGDAAMAKARATREAALLAFDGLLHAARADARFEAMAWSAADAAWREGSEPRRRLAEAELASIRAGRAAGTESRLMELTATAMLAERAVQAIGDRAKATAAAIRLERAIGGFPLPATQLTGTEAVAADSGGVR